MQSQEKPKFIAPVARGTGNLEPSFSALGVQEHNYTWEQVWRVLRKHARFVLLVAGCLTFLVGLYVLLQRDFYRPTARLEIAPPGSGINTLHEIESTQEVENQDYLETQVQILGSDALAVSVIRDLHLDRHPEFVSEKQLKQSIADGKKEKRADDGKESSILQEQLDLANLTLAESIALDKFRKNLSVASVRNTRLVELSFSSHDPALAQSISNALVTKFIDQNYKYRYTTTMQASEWLSAQLNDLRRKVQESGQAVADYQKHFGLVEVDDRDVPMAQLMGEVNHKLSEAQADRIEDEAYVRMVDDGHADAVPTLRDDKLFQDLMTRYVDLRAQLAQAKTVYGDANVNVKKLQEQLSEISVQIDAERNRAIARVRSTYASAKHREMLMAKERDKLRANMAHVSSQLAEYHMLKTEANANVDLYNTLQGRLREAGIYAGLRSSNIRVVDLAANLRKPSGPHRFMVFLLGTLGSCFAAIVLCFLREGLHNTVRTPEDVKSWTGLPSLALLPAMGNGPRVAALHSGGLKRLSHLWGAASAVPGTSHAEIMESATSGSEAMRELRTALVHGRRENAPRVILISSSIEGEGKTTVAVNLAIALAQLGATCLVEGDLRQPGVSRAFSLSSSVGLADVLQGSTGLADAIVPVPGIYNLVVLPCGNACDRPSDVLCSPQMITSLETLKRYYTFIVIDTPPVIPFSDARFLSCLADEVVLVGRYGVTTRRCMQRTAELLDEVQASVAGVVLNGIDLSSPDYDYYTYGYSKWTRRPTGTPSKELVPPERKDADKPGAMGAHA